MRDYNKLAFIKYSRGCSLISLYVTSLDSAVGKTAICAGLGKHLLGDGKKVGFFKPIITGSETPPAAGADRDAAFMKYILALEEPLDWLCPVISGQDNLANRIKEACAKVSRGKDVVIVEGTCRPSPNGNLGKASYQVAEALEARVIVVADYSKNVLKPEFINSSKDFGEYLLGVVLNKVPRNQLERVSGEISARFGEAGVDVLGVFPEDRVLFTLTIGELAEHIQGEILNCAEEAVGLVENLMLGAMCLDSGPEYFGRKTNKAVVVRGERPDMQLAALETSMRCLVLSGNTASPITTVLHKAESKGIPIILAKGDTIATVTGIEDALGKTRFSQERKLPRLAEIMEQHFNFQAVAKGLG